MSTLIVGAILLAAIAIVSWGLIAISGRQTKKRKQQLLTAFSIAGSANNLSFTAQEILKSRIIGIDAISKKIVVVEEKENTFHHFIIDLNEVRDCSVQKNFLNVPMESKTERKEMYLQSICLQFDFKESMKPQQQVVFYDNVHNHVYEISELETKAKEWQGLVSQFFSKKEPASVR